VLAPAYARGQTVDVFLCDVNIGDQPSTGLLAEVIGAPGRGDIRVVMVSAEAQYRATCDALGVEFFLEKPVDLQDLLRLVERLAGANDVL
jgi:DNA-binding NtrC family response regulator